MLLAVFGVRRGHGRALELASPLSALKELLAFQPRSRNLRSQVKQEKQIF